MLCTRFVIRRRNDRKMKTLRALRDPPTAAGEEVLIERVDLRRANNISRKHAVFCARFTLRTRHPSARVSRYSFKLLQIHTWGGIYSFLENFHGKSRSVNRKNSLNFLTPSEEAVDIVNKVFGYISHVSCSTLSLFRIFGRRSLSDS